MMCEGRTGEYSAYLLPKYSIVAHTAVSAHTIVSESCDEAGKASTLTFSPLTEAGISVLQIKKLFSLYISGLMAFLPTIFSSVGLKIIKPRYCRSHIS